MFIFEGEHEPGRGREKEGDTDPKRAPSSELQAQSPTQGSNSPAMRSCMTWTEDGRLNDWATQAPLKLLLKVDCFSIWE